MEAQSILSILTSKSEVCDKFSPSMHCLGSHDLRRIYTTSISALRADEETERNLILPPRIMETLVGAHRFFDNHLLIGDFLLDIIILQGKVLVISCYC